MLLLLMLAVLDSYEVMEIFFEDNGIIKWCLEELIDIFFLVRKLVIFDEWNNFSVNVALDNIVIMDEISKFVIFLHIRSISLETSVL